MNERLQDEPPAPPPLRMWVIAELFGHKRVAGLLSEQMVAGVQFVRIDVPQPDGDGFLASPLYAPKAIYALHPTTEELARQAARVIGVAKPVHEFELRALTAGGSDDGDDGDEPERW